MKRVALSGMYTEEEVKALESHLNNMDRGLMEQEKLDALRAMYRKLPNEFHYTGPIYRGVRINKDTAVNFLNNSSFTTGDTSGEKMIESWTYELDIALGFVSMAVAQTYTIDVFGAVLESTTYDKEVVGIFNEEIHEHIADNVDAGVANHYLSTMEVFMREHEILVANTDSARQYNLCDDVNYLMVNNRNVFLGENYYLKEALFMHLDQYGIETLKSLMTTTDMPIATVLKCDNGGGLSIHDLRYSSL